MRKALPQLISVYPTPHGYLSPVYFKKYRLYRQVMLPVQGFTV